MNSFSVPRIRHIVPRLERWYLRHHRRLPWRAAPGAPPNPYHILLSEIMLQQTQVATVVPYFLRFLARFPTLASLARASQQDVLALWQGLGYYHRARHLHTAAQLLLKHHAGCIPSDPKVLRSLPGVGPYTAAAVASIAFDQPLAVLDGNVARLLARLLAVRRPINRSAIRRHLHHQAQLLVQHSGRPGDLNQALMELGALVCTPFQPACPRCPLARFCQARKENLASRLPVRSASPPPLQLFHHVLAIEDRGRLRFEHRPPDGLWPGLWQLTTCESASPHLAAADLIRWARRHHHLFIHPLTPCGQFTHALSHRTLRVRLWKATLARPLVRSALSDPSVQWRSPHRLDDLPLSALQRRAVGLLIRSGD